MPWIFLDHTFWQTFLAVIALVAAYIIGRNQIRIQDSVELYCSLGIIKFTDGSSDAPFVHIQNVGTRLIYVDRYVFNGREYNSDSQILPSTYSNAQNSFYRVELPSNGEGYVSMDIYYHDLEGRHWMSRAVAQKGGPLGWNIKTLPRTAITQ